MLGFNLTNQAGVSIPWKRESRAHFGTESRERDDPRREETAAALSSSAEREREKEPFGAAAAAERDETAGSAVCSTLLHTVYYVRPSVRKREH